MSATEECDLDWTVLPPETRTGHILKHLKTYTLISVVKYVMLDVELYLNMIAAL